ncbi:glycosyl transferase family 1 [Paenibacillus physcomitrellae]|uniref:Glycosyl transferase family 1 n=2 Tax=Paenibacillus physcomitrellae TaxID=1619311 RepID=A0ABQ1FY17_9BACL|nr:glycosyl transferase family 1 [Paenibacillus physcomitrellae]
MDDLRQAGFEVHAYAARDERREDVELAGFECRDLPFSRNPVDPGNFKAWLGMYRLLRQEGYEVVHVHTPNAGFITRLAAIAAGTGNVFYTAHGFHFFQGAPLLNWLIYYPLERLAARWTDVLITINGEDFDRASRFKVRGRVVRMPGVGVEAPDNGGRDTVEKEALMQELQIPADAFILLCMAELNGNKNQAQLLHAVQRLRKDGIPVCCLIAGAGSYEERYKKLAEELEIQESVRFLGFRKDGTRLMAASDVVVLLSRREGLPKVLLEALGSGKPAVVTDVRGCRDLVTEGFNGFRVAPGDVNGTVRALGKLYDNPDLLRRMGAAARSFYETYRLEKVRGLMKELYQSSRNPGLNRGSIKSREGRI